MAAGDGSDFSGNLSRQDLAALLAWQAEMGADEAILDAPVNRLARAGRGEQERQTATTSSSKTTAAPVRPPVPAGMSPQAARDASLSQSAAISPAAAEPGLFAGSAASASPLPGGESVQALVARCATLEDIYAALDAMHDFPLRRTATHTVHTDGHPEARVLLVGEAPGRDEDLQGRPFVGRSGQLLDRMLAAIGLSRAAEDPARAVLITNVVFWRPPGNRKPTEAEVTWCMPWLRRTIEIVRPEIIVCLGATPTQRLTGRTQGILRLRGTWLECEIGDRRIPLLPTLHPAYLLRQPLQKRLAWRDLLSLKRRLMEAGLLAG